MKQKKLVRWMKQYLEDARRNHEHELINMYGIGEVNTTRLEEAAAYESGLIPEEDREKVFDHDEDLYFEVGDAAYEASLAYEQKYSPWLIYGGNR